MAPPQWAYQVENFITKPDDELVCSVCHAIFCEPVNCPCDHVFCRVCITKWLQNNRNCPICRKRVPRYSIKPMVPIVKNLILKLILSCRNKEHGCETQFTLEGCENHMKECSYELVQCKNKPCNEKIFRKDIEEHETSGCLHRYIKCKTCGSKMSTSTPPEDHNCISALQQRLRKKIIIIRRKNIRIKELKNEIKTLKETTHDSAISAETSLSNSSLSPDDIVFDVGELESFSSMQSDESSDSDDSSDRSIIAIFANSASDHYSDGNQSDTFSAFIDNLTNDVDHRNESPLDLSEYRNAGSQTVDDLSLLVSQDNSNRNNRSTENDNPHVEVHMSSVSDGEERFQPRRPAKRRLPRPQASMSEDENGFGDRPSLPSPKRCWRIPSTENNDATPESNAGDSSNSYMEAGPSQESEFTAVDYTDPSEEEEEPKDGASSHTKWHFRPRSKQNQKHSMVIRPTIGSTPTQGNGGFERTLSLLAQYNIESDPEWLPEYASHRGNDTTTDSDSSCEADMMGDSSSSSLSGDSNAVDLLKELYGSSSEDDPDWQPA